MCNENRTAAFLQKAFDLAALDRGNELIRSAKAIFGVKHATPAITDPNPTFGKPLLELSVASADRHRDVMNYLSRLQHRP